MFGESQSRESFCEVFRAHASLAVTLQKFGIPNFVSCEESLLPMRWALATDAHTRRGSDDSLTIMISDGFGS